jgi:hypothetical protein
MNVKRILKITCYVFLFFFFADIFADRDGLKYMSKTNHEKAEELISAQSGDLIVWKNGAVSLIQLIDHECDEAGVHSYLILAVKDKSGPCLLGPPKEIVPEISEIVHYRKNPRRYHLFGDHFVAQMEVSKTQ